MNIYEKIQAVRVGLQTSDLKMTGRNKYAEYNYFELDDFLKPLNRLMQANKLTAYASFTSEYATLTVVNSEKPDEVVTITSPMGTATLKGCHEVQNIGAVETYQRRYLYQAMFDIAESDTLNKTQGKPEQKAKQPEKGAKAEVQTTEQADQELPFEIADKPSNREVVTQALKGTKWTYEIAERCAVKNFSRSIDELNSVQLKEFILQIEGAKTNA